jgi:two-component system sensor histidine kinase/response regulator
MIPLGTLLIACDSDRLDLRRKIIALARAAGCDPVRTASITAEISGIIRHRSLAETLTICAGLDIERGLALAISFGETPARKFFLSHAAPPDHEWLETRRREFNEPSRETLLNELIAGREQLERTVEQRTVELRVAMDKAESANRTKSVFLAAMSHEIRTPMNAIINMVGAALEASPDPQQTEHLRIAHTSANHLLSLINDILDFSKIEAGKIDLESIPFSLHELLESVADLFRQKSAETGVELICDPEDGLPDGVRGDPTRLRQILVNLVGNAFKFTHHGEVTIRATSAGDSLRFEVRDSGIGMSPEQLARLFQPFSQADSSTTRKYGGTGLGLTISRSLARLMGGDITVDSAPGEGSGFTVEIRLPRDIAGDSHAAGLPAPLLGATILIVSDNPAVREAKHRLLTGHGLRCETFASAEAALAELEAHPEKGYAAAIVDLGPKGASGGPGLITNIRRCRPELPCLLVGPFADKALREAGKAAGASVFIPKPATWGLVRAALLSTLGASAPTASATPVDKPFEGVVALLAEDNEANRMVARMLLKKMGIALETAENGRIALAMAEATPDKYAVILMDMQMPEMDGIEATRRIRKNPRLHEVPIIAMTANAMKADTDACLAAGMNDFVTKPIDKNLLYAALRRNIRAVA